MIRLAARICAKICVSSSGSTHLSCVVRVEHVSNSEGIMFEVKVVIMALIRTIIISRWFLHFLVVHTHSLEEYVQIADIFENYA